MKRSVIIVILAVTLLVGITTNQPVRAQTPLLLNGWYTMTLCSTVDYDSIAAKALGIAAADLRTDLVSGQTLDDIAQAQNVTSDAVNRALLDAHFAEIDQAVSDGLLDQQSAQQLKNFLTNRNPSNPTTGKPPYGAIAYPYFGITDVTAYNFQAVKALPAAAKVMDLKCPDLVKEILKNRSIVAIATARGGQVGATVDAIIKAYQDALDQDIKEQLITAAQAKGLRVQLAVRAASLINMAGQPVLMQTLTLPGVIPGDSTAPQPVPYMLPGVSGGSASGGAAGSTGSSTAQPAKPQPPSAISVATAAATVSP